MEALLITVHGEIIEWNVDSLDDLQGGVGGNVQVVPFIDPTRLTLYCNEEGKLRNLPFNELATKLASLWGPKTHPVQDVLVGDCVLLGPVDDEGNDTPCTMLTLVQAMIHTAKLRLAEEN